MTRKEANFEIISNLINFFNKNKDIRFFQGLQILGLQSSELTEITSGEVMLIEDNFHEESVKTLNKLLK